MKRFARVALISLILISTSIFTAASPVNKMELTEEQRCWFRNPDGSCVQCSIGMCGVHTNTPEATTLLWDTEYGSRVRGGSGPSRVADYMNKRKIKGWNITGKQTYDWMIWCCATGRFAAIGAGGNHFQTLYGLDNNIPKYFVCNNNSPKRIDEYSNDGFHRLHESSGTWCVILEKSAPNNPEYVAWWKDDRRLPNRYNKQDYLSTWPVDKPNAPEIPIAVP